MGKIFGGGTKSTTSGTTTKSSAAGNYLENLLGVNGDPAAGFNNYLTNAGFAQTQAQGLDQIDAGAAAKGLLRSGSIGKAYGQYTSDLRNQYYNNYLQNILGLANVQNTTDSTATTSQKKKTGLGGLIKAGATVAAASDRRLKKNIFKVGELENGLNLYQYRYIDNTGPYVGVMADEVELIQPEALGPIVDGYKTVDYSKIQGVN